MVETRSKDNNLDLHRRVFTLPPNPDIPRNPRKGGAYFYNPATGKRDLFISKEEQDRRAKERVRRYFAQFKQDRKAVDKKSSFK
jgi:hypothetical protein|tara:strand:+ start:68 stop:319 length:252 start_codon:yes stop_codon:yes gene_type:complete